MADLNQLDVVDGITRYRLRWDDIDMEIFEEERDQFGNCYWVPIPGDRVLGYQCVIRGLIESMGGDAG